jgi:hypothetical protein
MRKTKLQEKARKMGDYLQKWVVLAGHSIWEGDRMFTHHATVPSIAQLNATRRLRFNSGIELSHRKPSAKSTALSFLYFDVYSLCRAARETLASKGMPRHRFRRWIAGA